MENRIKAKRPGPWELARAPKCPIEPDCERPPDKIIVAAYKALQKRADKPNDLTPNDLDEVAKEYGWCALAWTIFLHCLAAKRNMVTSN